jgi:hypothetical protein
MMTWMIKEFSKESGKKKKKESRAEADWSGKDFYFHHYLVD